MSLESQIWDSYQVTIEKTHPTLSYPKDRSGKSVCVMTKKIVLLENGSVREEGTFDELLKRDSLFNQFVHRQSLL